MSGFKIGMASDLHLGPLADSVDAQLSLDLLGVSEGNVDALMLVGDIGDQPINEALLEKFKPLKDAVKGGMEDRWVEKRSENANIKKLITLSFNNTVL